jgi:hypothetical protein
VISATEVYLPAGALVPPTTAEEGDAAAPSAAHAAIQAMSVLRTWFKGCLPGMHAKGFAAVSRRRAWAT